MFLYGGLCLLLYQEDLVLLYNPFMLAQSVFLGHHLVDGFVYTIAGVFLLRRQPWARRLAVGYSVIPALYAVWMTLRALRQPSVFDPEQFFAFQPFSLQGGSLTLAFAVTYVPLLMSCLFLWGLTRPQS
jgi:hypothetical protein